MPLASYCGNGRSADARMQLAAEVKRTQKTQLTDTRIDEIKREIRLAELLSDYSNRLEIPALNSAKYPGWSKRKTYMHYRGNSGSEGA